jgi:hypothetical protein
VDELPNRVTFPMCQGSTKHSLASVLAVLDGSELNWVLTGLWCVGRPPAAFPSTSISDFEESTSVKPYPLSWSELLEFSRQVEDLQDITLVGSSPGAGPVIRIVGFDSGTWEIDTSLELGVLMARLSNFSGATIERPAGLLS